MLSTSIAKFSTLVFRTRNENNGNQKKFICHNKNVQHLIVHISSHNTKAAEFIVVRSIRKVVSTAPAVRILLDYHCVVCMCTKFIASNIKFDDIRPLAFLPPSLEFCRAARSPELIMLTNVQWSQRSDNTHLSLQFGKTLLQILKIDSRSCH